MALTRVELANLALGHLGNFGSIENLTPPDTKTEKIMSQWESLSRRMALKALKPNFAITREYVSILPTTPPFGYSYEYLYPSGCLQILGVNDIDEWENIFTVEGDKIRTDETSDDGLALRYIQDIENSSLYTPEFEVLYSWYWAYNACQMITQDSQKVAYMEKIMPTKVAEAASYNAQENRPIRISNSLFKQSRNTDSPTNYIKK